MLQSRINIFLVLWGCLLLFPFQHITASDNLTKQAHAGYTAIVSYGNGFLASSTDGGITWISNSGEIVKSEKIQNEKLNCLAKSNQIIVVAGEKGSIQISDDDTNFRKVDSGTDQNINAIILFNEKFIAGADHGEVLVGDENYTFRKIQLDLKGNIVSLSAFNTNCYGVTDQGEIIHTRDGLNWTILDFNKVYDGYYQSCNFTSVIVNQYQVAVAGRHLDGSPALLLSSKGNVWTERPLNYTNEQGFMAFLDEIPNSLFYDSLGDQFVLVCNNGKLMTIPGCSHCNQLMEFSTNNLTGISGNETTILLVGTNYFIKAIKN